MLGRPYPAGAEWSWQRTDAT